MKKIEPEKKFSQNLGIFLILWLTLAIMLIGLFGCTSPKKAMSVLDSNPLIASDYCAKKYPVKDSIIFKDVLTFDTLVIDGEIVIDTLWKIHQDTVTREIVKTLPGKVITKTVTNVKEVYKENTARVENLQIQLSDCLLAKDVIAEKYKAAKESGEGFKKQRNKWRFRFFCLLAVIAGWKFLQYRYGLKF